MFEMLTLAQELGVEDLQNSCEEHVTSTMSVLNACKLLAAAMDIQDRASSKYITVIDEHKSLFWLKIVNSPLNHKNYYAVVKSVIHEYPILNYITF